MTEHNHETTISSPVTAAGLTTEVAVLPDPDVRQDAGACPFLTANDCCDADLSPVTAYVRVAKGTRILDFCKHHFEQMDEPLTRDGWLVADDQRRDLEAYSRGTTPDQDGSTYRTGQEETK